MATYSYSKAQLDKRVNVPNKQATMKTIIALITLFNKRDQPAKPFWSFPRIAAAIGFSGVVFIGTCIALTPRQSASVVVAPAAPVVIAQPAPVASTEAVVTEPVRDMPEACIKAKVTREECDQAIALYNAQQNQGPTWSGQEFNQNRKAWAE